MVRGKIYINVCTVASVLSWIVNELERKWLENWWQRSLGKRYVDRDMWMGNEHEDIGAPYVNVYKQEVL